MADQAQDYYRVDWSGRAIVDQATYPVSSIEVTYRINEIPSISLIIPMGKDPSTGARVSPKSVLSSIDLNVPLKVFINAQAYPSGRDAPKGGGLKQGDFKIFDGYVLAPGFVRDGNQAGVQITGFGALGGLASGTSLVDTVIEDIGDDSEGKMRSGLASYKNKVLTLDVLTKRQLWRQLGSGIIKIWSDMSNGAIINSKGPVSGLARAAINRLKFKENSLGFGSYMSTLAEAYGEEAWDYAVATSLSSIIFNSWSNSAVFEERDADLWFMLKETARLFEFSIVSTVEGDYLAPIIANLGGEPDHVIEPNEYFSIRAAPYDSRGYGYVTKVALFSQGAQSSNWNAGANKTSIVGLAQINTPDAGRLKLVGAPFWILPPGAPAKASINPQQGIRDATNTSGPEKNEDQGKLELSYYKSDLGNAYARTILYSELFGNRIISLRGRVRTDIAPGNQVKMVVPGDAFGIGGDDLYGMVSAVVIRLGEGQSHTELTVTNVRSVVEHGSYTVDMHPLHRFKWKGIPLI